VDASIADYAMIGDCETAALVHRSGSIDWLCLPRFDSDACFARLLGDRDNGHWSICARDVTETRRAYRDGTLILVTDLITKTGAARVIDFMTPRDQQADLIRLVEGIEGSVTFDVELVIRFDYGRTIPWVTHPAPATLMAVAGPNTLFLQTPIHLHGQDMRTQGVFAIQAGERVPFALTHRVSLSERPPQVEAMTALANTEKYWCDFSDRCPPVGPWTLQVKRSLITLKALTFGPTGGMVAAATTSLPEKIGGTRNWDYRFCWLRDATFTLQAFMSLGYYDEASAWRDWLMRAIAGDPAQMQIMYGVSGERRLAEWEAPWLSGFRGSRPVRIGNAAAEQMQLDVRGEVIDAMARAVKGGIAPHPRSAELRRASLEHLSQVWREPDEGIWEMRAGRQHFTHSKVMAWVAFDRALTYTPQSERDREDHLRWRATANEIHAEICERAFDRAQNAFTQVYGQPWLDASLLQMALVGFLPPSDPRILGTIAAIAKRLVRDGLTLRYETDLVADGLPPGEGRFLACSFWLADNLVLTGRRAEACALFERLLALCNDVGLLAEQYDPDSGEMLGNFPQAFSHVGLINTAVNLARSMGPEPKRAAVASVKQPLMASGT
jgi:GH15 family glucan-1,4-alpha-glucosidase